MEKQTNKKTNKKISEWAHQWKMLFNPDPRKQATEVYFSKTQNQDDPLMREFNYNTNQIVEVNKHLGLSLDEKCDFNVQIDNKINKRNKIIDILIFRVSVLERWYRKLLFFYKIHGLSPAYLTASINFASERSYNTRQLLNHHFFLAVLR